MVSAESAWLYHVHHTHDQEDLPFWQGLASGASGRVLELGCGTGRVLLPLLRAGQAICGVDLDGAMLGVLLAQLRLGETRPWLIQADMTALRLACRFPLILLPCNTYSTLSAAERRGVLACVDHHLTEAGRFAVSLPNPAMLQSIAAYGEEEVEEVFDHPASGNPVQVSSAWQRQGKRLTVYWHYDHLFPDGRGERLTSQVTHAIQPAEAYQEELAAGGLALQACYGDFDRSPYAAEAPYLILVAGKR